MRAAVMLAVIAGAIVAVIVGGGSGCLRSTQFECSTNVDCTRAGAQGTCEAVGFCSFGDPSCEGGRRFGDLSGPFANQCIPPPDAAVPDAPIDAAIDAYVHDARECFGSGAYMLCFAGMPPMGPVTLAGTLDTDTDARCAATMPQSWTDAGQPAACLIMGNTISVTGALTVSGARPLVLLADVMTIGGVIDVAAHRGVVTPVPLSPATQCAAFPNPPPVGDLGGGGAGAGGSFMRAGGNGGRGNNAPTVGGTAAPMDTVAPVVLRGGCPGQAGGTGLTGSTVGAPGQGGGAIFITASTLTISSGAGINASGSGALGGTALAGGSGGGTGGMIVLHIADTITANGARMIANGGGGSAGADDAAAGTPGADPMFASPTSPAAGGTGVGRGANGGNGFAGTNQAQNGDNGGAAGNDSGGGGGGGAGYIQSNKALTGATVSPAATIVP